LIIYEEISMFLTWIRSWKRPKNAIILLFIILFLGQMASCITGGIASQSWPSVAGTITKSEEEVDDDMTYDAIAYVFIVNDRQYTGERVSFGFSSHALERYPVGRTVQVYYSPENPTVSVLEPGFGINTKTATVAILLLVLVIALFGVIIALGKILIPTKRPQPDL